MVLISVSIVHTHIVSRTFCFFFIWLLHENQGKRDENMGGKKRSWKSY
jgi:hypothetical protein